MENSKSALPENFLLDITNIAGSSDDVCLKAIQHYKNYLNYPEPVVQQISKAMIGNLTEYFNLSHQGSSQFEKVLPHLSDVANFMDSKNSPNMDVQSTARIKSLFSDYEKLLSSCADNLENNKPIPDSGFAKDLIATRDVLYPRYHLRNDPQAFYKHVYSTILEFMEYIDKLSQDNPEYGFEPVATKKQQELMKPKKYHFPKEESETITIPDNDFLGYAFNTKGIPEVYRYLVAIASKLDKEIILKDIQKIQSETNLQDLQKLSLIHTLQNEIKKESLVAFRNSLEQELLDSMPLESSMFKDYTTKSKEDFLYIHKGLKPIYKDYLSIISNIDDSLETGTSPTLLTNSFAGGNATTNVISEKLSNSHNEQNTKLQNIIEQLSVLDLDNFEQVFETAKKLHYFSICSKDYMKHPKETGYQSFHIFVRTPFGKYEKQIRTQAQHHFAEYGHASHSNNYKPYEKENFHRLKVCTPLMPKRDQEKNIILPIQLEPLGLEEAIREYYRKDFSFFSGGLSMDQFKTMHFFDFDEAMLSLSQPNEQLLERVSKGFNFLKKIKNKIIPKAPPESNNPFDNR